MKHLFLTLAILPLACFADEMADARAALYASHGSQTTWAASFDRLEWWSAEGDDRGAWESEIWRGGDLNKFVFASEGEYEDGGFEEAEFSATWRRAIAPFWDVDIGIRHDTSPSPQRAYGVIGLHGTAPYWIGVDADLILSERGTVSARVELGYELHLTRRWLAETEIELNASLDDDPPVEVGQGFNDAEVRIRFGYQVTPQVVPYVGVGWHKAFGDTADFVRKRGSEVSVLAGVSFWW